MEVIDLLDDASVNCIFTSPNPPANPQEMVYLVHMFDKAKRILADDASIWVQMGDYLAVEPDPRAGTFMLLPQTFTMMMAADGWLAPNKPIIWSRKGEKLRRDPRWPDRFVADYEYVMHFTRGGPGSYYFNNRQGVTESSIIEAKYKYHKPGEFISGFPPELINICLRATTKLGDWVLDPMADSCSTLIEAMKLGRNGIGIELDAGKLPYMEERCKRFGTSQSSAIISSPQ